MPDVLVTGAARGLGRATTELLAERGVRVFATDADAAALDDLAGRDSIVTIPLDVTAAAAAARAADQVEREAGGLDGLVNNAGIPHAGSVVATPVALGTRVFEINMLGAYRVTNALLPMLHRRRGRVVVIGSEAARFPQGFSLYSVSKIALEAWADALRQELRLEGMRVAVIRPGAHGTGLLEAVRRSMAERAADPILGRWMPRVAAIAERSLSEGADPRDVAAAVLEALTARRPKRTYHVNNNPRLRVVERLPAPARDALITLALRTAAPPGRRRRFGIF